MRVSSSRTLCLGWRAIDKYTIILRIVPRASSLNAHQYGLLVHATPIVGRIDGRAHTILVAGHLRLQSRLLRFALHDARLELVDFARPL